MNKFTGHEKQVFNWVLIAIGLVAVVSNCLLIRLARRLENRTPEIRLAVVLAFVDMAIPLLGITGSLANNWYSDDFDRFQKFCRFKGPIDFLLQYFSLLLVAIIAMERFSKVRGSKIPSGVWIMICVCTTSFISLVLMTAFQGEFYTSPSEVDCFPIARTSTLSAVVIFGLGFFMLVSLLVTLCCYLCILSFIREAQAHATVAQKRSTIVTRVICICLVYILLIPPSSIMIMMEATYNYMALNKTSLTVSILVDLNSVSNPCLVLFAHSFIFEQLQLCLPFSRRSKPQPTSPNISIRSLI